MAVPGAPSKSVTEAIARFACGADFSGAPDELMLRAIRAVIDTVGVAIAARQEPSFTILAKTLGLADGAPGGEAMVFATRTRTTVTQAALLNGVAGHALDFDDVSDHMTGHPSVVLVSTLFALAEAHGSTGPELLESYVVGLQAAAAIAAGLPVEAHYRRGWHATSTIGVLAAAAAAARLLRLDETAARNALGIAASMASGSRQNFGTMTKPLHAGLAARDAALAAQLASSGFTADQHQLEGQLGYFQLYGADPDLTSVAQVLQDPWVLLEHGLNVKKYACCYNAHRMADAALELYRRHGLRADSVQSMIVTVEPGGSQAIIHHRPRTGLEGKFSGEYVLAASLLDGELVLSSFTDEAVSRADAQDLLRRVSIHEAPAPPFGDDRFDHGYATLEVTLNDGRIVCERCDAPRGDARVPLMDVELEAKFRDCVGFGGNVWNADALLQQLWDLRSAPRVSLR